MAAPNKGKKVAFGSCQERKMFPTHSVPNRMGNELNTLEGSITPGPGCYDNHDVDSFVCNLKRRPECKKGYALGARTAPRFLPPFQTVTPSPQKYQKDWSESQISFPGKTITSNSPRFKDKRITVNPGPGTYMPDYPCNRKVSWPMKLGSPDWSKVPMPERKALHIELPSDKEFKTHRNRLAYLRLYY